LHSLKELASTRALSDILTAEEASVYGVASENSNQALDGEAHPDDPDKSSKPEAENLAKYISMREEMYKKAKEYESKIIGFELAIRRPYFHVKPLDNPELENWHNYLDFIEKEEDINKVWFCTSSNILSLLFSRFYGMFEKLTIQSYWLHYML